MPLVLLKADPRARLRPCLRCGYSLRSITDARNCPECGLAIRLSLSGDDALDVSKPEWVRGLAVAIAVAAVPHLLVLAVVVAALVQAAGGTRAVFVFRILRPSAVVVFAVGAYLIVRGVGLLLLARPEGRVPDVMRGLRRALATFGYAGFVAGVGLLALGATGRRTLPLTLILLLSLAMDLATWALVRDLARRLPNRRLTRAAGALAWVGVIAMVFVLLEGRWPVLLALLSPWRAAAVPWLAFLVVYPAVSIGLLLFTAGALRGAAEQAVKNWVSDPEFR
jgi:hypothetical protein